MPSFEKQFSDAAIAAGGVAQEIEYEGKILISIDRVPVDHEFRARITFISTNSEWRQGLKIRTDKEIQYEELKGKTFVFWQDNFNNPLEFNGATKNGVLSVWNCWETPKRYDNDGRLISQCAVHSWLNGAAMIREDQPDGSIIYRCNDGHPDDNFDDIVFKLEIL